MELDLILWVGGMLFSLGIIAVKAGVAFGLGAMRWRGILLTLALYLALFVLTAILSKQLMDVLTPVLKKGPYLHLLTAAVLMGWGILLLRRQASKVSCGIAPGHTPRNSIIDSPVALLVPCPVCLAAMTFSTATALNVIKLPPVVVGLGVGALFSGLSLLVYVLMKTLVRDRFLFDRRIGLGLGMIGIGLYFVASLFIPGQIEAAKSIYSAFLGEKAEIATKDGLGVLALLVAAAVLGFFTAKRTEVTR